MKTKYLRGDGPNDGTETLVQPDYSFGRGKVVPPAIRPANGPGGMGQGSTPEDFAAMIEAGKRVLDEALK